LKNKTELLSIGLFSILLDSIGVYIDGDKNTLSILDNIKEFILMSILVFIALSAVYFSVKFVLKQAKQLLA
jgi:membrane-anchored glycerophosphoryl diester phosphodiesterase (GDPDase)